MITITKGRLLTIKQWRETYGPGSNVVLPAEEAEELARIALASLEAKSRKLFTCSGCGAEGLDEPLESKCHCNEDGAHWVEGIVYTAQPAQVSVPAAMEMDDDFDSAFEHGKAVGWNACRAAMLQSQGNCIKDGWISCSDRMPEDTKMLLAFSQGEIVAAYWNWVVNPIDYKKYRAFTYLSGNILDDVTHWMPLPEPPL